MPGGHTNQKKLVLFEGLFLGCLDRYGTYAPGTIPGLAPGTTPGLVPATCRSWCVHQPVTRRVLLDHLRGHRPYGPYLLTGSTTRAVAIDFDHDDLNPVIACVDTAQHYGLPGYVERSKSKGYHIWFFFVGPVEATWARAVMRMLLSDIGLPGTEVFPKQDRLEPGQTGNFINAPLFGQLVPHGRTMFLDPRKGWEPYADQWLLLEHIRRVSRNQLDELVEINELLVTSSDCPPSSSPTQPAVTPSNTYGLPPCAVSILSQGVTENQRVVCFRLAIHLCRLGFPEDLARVLLRAWAQKNHPPEGKRIITDDEIARQTRDGYSGRYRGYGCDDPVIASHCQGRCPVRQPPHPETPNACQPLTG